METGVCPSQCSFNLRVYDTRDDFSFPIVNFPFMDGDVLWFYHMAFTFLNSLVLHVFVIMSATSMIVIS